MVQPLPVPGDLAAQRGGDLRQRQHPEQPGPVQRLGAHVLADPGADAERPPHRVEAQGERPAIVNPVAVHVAGGDHREHADQGGMGQSGRKPLGGPDIAAAHQPDLAIAPGLAGAPRLGVVPILALVDKGEELPLAVVLAAHILQHDHIAPAGIEVAIRRAEVVVGGALEQHRECSGGVRAVDIGRQPDPIAHRHFQVELGPDPVGALRLGSDRESRQQQGQRQGQSGGREEAAWMAHRTSRGGCGGIGAEWPGPRAGRV